MEMQDKEFDELFRSKLDNFEAEPSAGVWTRVENGLRYSARKKYLLPLLSVAASILILLVAGVLFMPQGGKTGGKSHTKNTIAKNIRPIIAAPTASGSKAIAPEPITKNKIDETVAVVNRKVKRHPVKATEPIQHIDAEHKIETEQPVKIDDQQVLASVQPKQQEIIKPVVPDERTPLAAKQTTEESTSSITKPVLVTAQLPINKDDATPIKTKHKIRTLGDFINVVVAKVDKRRDKIIEFADDDDDSIISAVNLGIIKLKKKNN